MTNKQESKLKMYLAVKDFLVPKEAETKDIPEFTASVTEFVKIIGQIQLIDEQQKNVITGVAKDKTALRKKLISLAADNSRKVYAFAKLANNTSLIDEVNFSLSELARMTDMALNSFAEILYKKAQEHLGSLAAFGINEASQKVFEETLAGYNNAVVKPRVSIAEKSKATRQLGEHFIACDAILKKIDALIGIIRLEKDDLFKTYKTVRKVVDTRTTSVSIRAIARELSTGLPLKNAVFTFRYKQGAGTDQTAPRNFAKKTAAKGQFILKNLQSGTYKVTVSKPGYAEKALQVSISDGERKEIIVELENIA